MALKAPFMTKCQIGNTDLSLRADPGEAFVVWDIFTYDPTLDYITVKIEKTTVGYFRVRSILGGHQVALRGRKTHSHHLYTNSGAPISGTAYLFKLKTPDGKVLDKGLLADSADGPDVHAKNGTRFNWPVRNETLLGWLRKMGIWTGFPVAEGETFLIEGGKNTNGRQVIIYSQHDPEDITPDMPNGSKSSQYLFINYGNCGASIQATADNLYNTSKNPAEFPTFPFGAVCPAKHNVEILGICASPFAPKENDGTDYSYTRYLKLLKDREVLFDEDRNGIIFENRSLDLDDRIDEFAEGISLIGNKSEYDDNDPLMFDPPLLYEPGDELNIYVTLVVGGSGQAIDIYDHEIALIERVTRID